MAAKPLITFLGLLAACSGDGHGRPGTLYARVSWPPHDTARIALPVLAYRCGHGADFLIQGIQGGNGVLIWTRYDRVDKKGNYPLLARGDSLTPRGAMVAVRFMVSDVARGLAMDSGVVTLAPAGDRISVQARGAGLDYSAGQRIAVDASVESAPLARDTVHCQLKL